ncbi:MAG TPA: hypothetical protein VGK54_03080, partial [Chloroflexota bacterium]
VTDLGDDFNQVPLRDGKALIFMIGCGHVEDGQWQCRCFTSSSLTETGEAEMIQTWLEHMTEWGCPAFVDG